MTTAIATTIDPLDVSTCPAWCSGRHDSMDNDATNWHQSVGWEFTTRSGDFPRHQSVTIAMGQSTNDAAAGATPTITVYVNDDERTPTITVYVNDDERTPPVTVGFNLAPWQAEQLARMLAAEAALAL